MTAIYRKVKINCLNTSKMKSTDELPASEGKEVVVMEIVCPVELY